MKLLLTGFEPFGGQDINPSWEAVRLLPDTIGDHRLIRLQVPVVFGLAAEKVMAAAEEYTPDAILCVGQAGGRMALSPERVAVNLRDAAIPDNSGVQITDEPVMPDGPAAFFSTLPVKRISEAIRKEGIPSSVSLSAGSFVCNDLYYTLLARYEGTNTRVGFLHVPFLPEQARNDEPSLDLESIRCGLLAAVICILEER